MAAKGVTAAGCRPARPLWPPARCLPARWQPARAPSAPARRTPACCPGGRSIRLRRTALSRPPPACSSTLTTPEEPPVALPPKSALPQLLDPRLPCQSGAVAPRLARPLGRRSCVDVTGGAGGAGRVANGLQLQGVRVGFGEHADALIGHTDHQRLAGGHDDRHRGVLAERLASQHVDASGG